MKVRSVVLAAGAFAVGTSGYVVAGILPAVSVELGVSAAAAGQLTTVFAFAFAVGAPVLATLTATWDRRTVLLVALLTAAAGNVIAALAPDYGLLLVGRAVTALGAAGYLPAATVVTSRLLGPERHGRAVAIVFGGFAFSLVLGVPLGNLLGAVAGYHAVFGLVTLFCVAAGGAAWLVLPSVTAAPDAGIRARVASAGDSTVLAMLGVTAAAVLATMSVYTFVVPLLMESAGIDGHVVGMLLSVYGLGAVAGNMLGGWITDRFGGARTASLMLVMFVAVMVSWPFTATTVAGAALAVFLWSFPIWAFNPAAQHRLLALAPQNGGLVLSLHTSAIYLGQGMSGVVGGVVVDSFGVLGLPLVSAAFGATALALLGISLLRIPRVSLRRVVV
jgi:DHA1 family purine base/nucleoside efflux pump-like MFS transporter